MKFDGRAGKRWRSSFAEASVESLACMQLLFVRVPLLIETELLVFVSFDALDFAIPSAYEECGYSERSW